MVPEIVDGAARLGLLQTFVGRHAFSEGGHHTDLREKRQTVTSGYVKGPLRESLVFFYPIFFLNVPTLASHDDDITFILDAGPGTTYNSQKSDTVRDNHLKAVQGFYRTGYIYNLYLLSKQLLNQRDQDPCPKDLWTLTARTGTTKVEQEVRGR